jgi:tetratricopeptide (TPR) repeat protein
MSPGTCSAARRRREDALRLTGGAGTRTVAKAVLLAICIIASLAAIPSEARCASDTGADLLAPVRASFDSSRAAAEAAPDGSLRRARALFDAGEPEGAWEILSRLPRGTLEAEALRMDVAFELHRFEEARESLEELKEIAPEAEATRRREVEWFLAADDLEGLERFCNAALADDPASTAALLGRGRIHRATMQKQEAKRWFREALARAHDDWERVRALEGIADVCYDERGYDSSLVYIEKALPLPAADDRLLESLNLTLIRLGRVAEAIDAAELAVLLNPYNEQAQYQLGNGYTSVNYSELEKAHPEAFPDAEEASALAGIDSIMAVGGRDGARAALEDMSRNHGNLTDLHVRLGSLYFEQGDYDAALTSFQEGLHACPGNGRARNGVSKALEAKRAAIDVHRDAYERAFAEAPWPEVPRIEDFVLNYDYLSDRHRKRVAMSIAPLARFVPVLVESGSTFYIKPLHERLSSCPGLETLKDARIDYDSRLWDDVRGCGGYSTVTGIEDVERTVHNGYDTVLHELVHQVHGILTADEDRVIQDLYSKAKERGERGLEAFVSRYQASSVWEYFAEGVNSYMHPRRDRYDTRQVVRERLEARDPDLAAFVKRVLSTGDVERYYAVGYANAGDDRLSRNRVDEAIALFNKSLERDRESAEGERGLIVALSVRGDNDRACEIAFRALEAHPDKARVVVAATRARYLKDGDVRARMDALRRARAGVEGRERYLIDLELADACLSAGEIAAAIDAFQGVLEYQADNPDALWGMGFAVSLTGDMEAARDYFESALRRRSGLVNLRADYAEALIRAGDFAGANAQLREAELLSPGGDRVLAAEGWLEMAEGNPAAAIGPLESALESAPHNDRARILLGRARLESGDPEGAMDEFDPVLRRIADGAPPEYRYNRASAAFELIHTLPGYERALLYETASRASRALGRDAEAERLSALAQEALRLRD